MEDIGWECVDSIARDEQEVCKDDTLLREASVSRCECWKAEQLSCGGSWDDE